MFIPAWVLAVVGVVLLVVFGRLWLSARELKDEKGRLKVGTPDQPRDGSVKTQQIDPAPHDDAPAAPLLSTYLGLHNMRIAALSNPVSIMKAQISFASSIHLGEQLLRFYRDVVHFPSWYALHETYPGHEPWTSSVIPRDAISRVKTSELKSFGIDVPDYENDALIYRFSAADRDYAFCARGDAIPDWIGDLDDEPRWAFSAFRAYVVELPAKVVLEDQVAYRHGDIDVYYSDSIASFRPAEWLIALLKTADAVRAESEAKYAESLRKSEAERAKKFS